MVRANFEQNVVCVVSLAHPLLIIAPQYFERSAMLFLLTPLLSACTYLYTARFLGADSV